MTLPRPLPGPDRPAQRAVTGLYRRGAGGLHAAGDRLVRVDSRRSMLRPPTDRERDARRALGTDRRVGAAEGRGAAGLRRDHAGAVVVNSDPDPMAQSPNGGQVMGVTFPCGRPDRDAETT